MENPIDTSAPNRSTAHGRRLWYVLGTGGLLLVILGGLVARMSWYRQVQAIAEIERLGGSVETVPFGPGWLRSIVGDEVMLGYDYVYDVALVGTTQVTDVGLGHITGLTKLQELHLLDTQVTDAGLVHLKGLTKLQSLYIRDMQVTDAGLVRRNAVATPGNQASTEYQATPTPSKTVFTFSIFRTSNKFAKVDFAKCC